MTTINLRGSNHSPINEHEHQRTSVKKRGFGGWVIFALVLIVIVGGIFSWFKFGNKQSAIFVDPLKYQAVFLSNGQSYFGKVTNEEKDYVNISDVYYLVLKQPLQSQQDQGNDQSAKSAPEYSLIKLGKEIHGPISMAINRSQITFIENLSDDSKLVQAIKNGSAK